MTFHQRTFTSSSKNERQIQTLQTTPPALVSQQVPVGPARPKEIHKAITAGPSSETTRMIASIDTTSERRVIIY